MSQLSPPGPLFEQNPSVGGDDDCFFTPARRVAIYALALVILSSLTIFVDLGGDSMGSDEALYAMCADNLREGGGWMSISPDPPQPYFQKPPLYVWLTRLTYPLMPDPARYRFWSALAGVGCVSCTLLLGALLVGPEAGLIAGLLLLTNHRFLVLHGARSGTFDTCLTFCFMASLTLYWLTTVARGGRWAWMLIGLFSGMACLFKPFGGALALTIIAAHALFGRRDRDLARSRWRGMLVALVVMFVVAAPWYAAESGHFGRIFWWQIFRLNLVDRATHGIDPRQVEGWAYYLLNITGSSETFRLFLPAVLMVLGASFWGTRRREMAFLAFTIIALIVIFSFSASKLLHYVYPAFGLIAIAIAELMFAAMRAADRWTRMRAPSMRLAPALVAMTAAALVWRCDDIVRNVYPDAERNYPPIDAYRQFKPAIEQGLMRVILYGLPLHAQPAINLDARDVFYLRRMRRAIQIGTPQALEALLATPVPTILLWSTFAPSFSLEEKLNLDKRSDPRWAYSQDAFVMRLLDTGPLLNATMPGSADATAAPSEAMPTPSIKLVGPANGEHIFSDGLHLSLTTPILADVQLRLVVHLKTPVPLLRWTGQMDGKLVEDMALPVFEGPQELDLKLSHRRLATPGAHELILQATDISGKYPIGGEVRSVKVTLRPIEPSP